MPGGKPEIQAGAPEFPPPSYVLRRNRDGWHMVDRKTGREIPVRVVEHHQSTPRGVVVHLAIEAGAEDAR